MRRNGARMSDDLDPDDLEIDINLRAPAEVAARALIVGAVCRRGFLEQPDGGIETDDPEADRFDLGAWLRDEGVDPLATPAERRLIETRLGRLPDGDAEAATWQVEGLVALCWTLNLLTNAPPYDSPAIPGAVFALVPSPWDKTGAFRGQAVLRTEAEIAVERERAELWHWRAGIADLLLGATGRGAAGLRRVIRDVAEDAARGGVFAEPAGHDFPVNGRPYHHLDDAGHAVLAGLAAERLRALNWLCGFGADWDHVPIDA